MQNLTVWLSLDLSVLRDIKEALWFLIKAWMMLSGKQYPLMTSMLVALIDPKRKTGLWEQ